MILASDINSAPLSLLTRLLLPLIYHNYFSKVQRSSWPPTSRNKTRSRSKKINPKSKDSFFSIFSKTKKSPGDWGNYLLFAIGQWNFGQELCGSRHGGGYLGFGSEWEQALHLHILHAHDQLKKDQGCPEHPALLSAAIHCQHPLSRANLCLVAAGDDIYMVNKAELQGRLSFITIHVELPVYEFLPVASCPISWHYQEKQRHPPPCLFPSSFSKVKKGNVHNLYLVWLVWRKKSALKDFLKYWC